MPANRGRCNSIVKRRALIARQFRWEARDNQDGGSVSRRGDDCHDDCRAQEFCSTVAERQSASVFGVACEDGRPDHASARARCACDSFRRHLDDGGVVNEAIDGAERHSRIREAPVPLSKRLIGGDQHGTPLVASADELDQHPGLGLLLGDVDKIIADQEVEAIERLMAASRLACSNIRSFLDHSGASEARIVTSYDQLRYYKWKRSSPFPDRSH